MNWLRKNISGILLSFILALAAAWLGNKYPIIGGPVFGIVLGIIINNTLGKPEWSADGIRFTSKKILQWAIIVLGSSLSLTQVWETGLQSLSVMLFTLSCAFISTYAFGKLMKIPFKLTSLIGFFAFAMALKKKKSSGDGSTVNYSFKSRYLSDKGRHRS